MFVPVRLHHHLTGVCVPDHSLCGAADTGQLPTNQTGYCRISGERIAPHRE